MDELAGKVSLTKRVSSIFVDLKGNKNKDY
jgi:hypothetical protein